MKRIPPILILVFGWSWCGASGEDATNRPSAEEAFPLPILAESDSKSSESKVAESVGEAAAMREGGEIFFADEIPGTPDNPEAEETVSVIPPLRPPSTELIPNPPPPNHTEATDTSPTADPDELRQALVERLQHENAQLREENRQLRRLLVTMESVPAEERPRIPEAFFLIQSVLEEPGNMFWLSATNGTRHNHRCRYFRTSAGRTCGPNEGVACKICGG